MKKKIYNIIIICLIVLALIVLTMIVVRYGKNYLNEKDIKETLSIIESKINNLDDNNDLLDVDYKGYKVEAIIEIPAIDIKYPVVNITNDNAMKIAITKFAGPEANEVGNYTIAGHNNKDGTMFGKTKYLKLGDKILLTNLKNETVEYEIFKIYSIEPSDVSCIDSVDPNSREITLITCTNGHRNRLITKAREIKKL